MRIALALLFVAYGCGTNKGTGATTDAMTVTDAGDDVPTAQPDAADAPALQSDAADAPAVQPDATTDTTPSDAGGGDAGPFSCAAGVTCEGSQYCEPVCCSPCFDFDGGACPGTATSCTLGTGGAGCWYCSGGRCVNTIPFDCQLSGVGDPRRLYCRCN